MNASHPDPEALAASLPEDIARAAERIAPHVRRTPVEEASELAALAGCFKGEGSPCPLVLKLENLQVTGSFKVRGALAKLLSLPPKERERGVVAASSGNHGIAVAHAGRTLGVPVTVFVPDIADPGKVERIRSLGGEVRFAGADCVLAEAAARREADSRGRAYVSPYNDAAVIAGQGTIGLELLEQVPDLGAVVVALGGGGLASGIAAAVKAELPDARIIAASPEASCVLHRSLEAGEILDLPSLPTLSDGTAGGVESDSITFDLCRSLIDRTVLVSEAEIAEAMRQLLAHHHTLVEGAAGVALAGWKKLAVELAPDLAGRPAAVVLCGANVSLPVLRGVLGGAPAREDEQPPGPAPL